MRNSTVNDLKNDLKNAALEVAQIIEQAFINIANCGHDADVVNAMLKIMGDVDDCDVEDARRRFDIVEASIEDGRIRVVS